MGYNFVYSFIIKSEMALLYVGTKTSLGFKSGHVNVKKPYDNGVMKVAVYKRLMLNSHCQRLLILCPFSLG